MPINTIHTAGPIVVAGTGGFNLDGVETVSPAPTLTEVMLEPAGLPDMAFIAMLASNPVVNARVNDIKTALSSIAMDGLKFPQTTVITTVTFYFTKVDERGTRATGANHFSVALNEGLITPNEITAAHGAHATMSITAHPTYDGTNAPFVYSNTASIPHTPILDELFKLGPIKINGTTLDGVTNLSLDFGIELIKESSGGEPYPTFVAIQRRRPRFTITTRQLPSLNTFGLTGTAQTATDSVIYLRKITENGVEEADASAVHISFTIDDGMIWTSEGSADNNDPGSATVILQPSYDGTNPIIAISTATAIT